MRSRITWLEFRAAVRNYAAACKANFDPAQPRDELGRWTDTGGALTDFSSAVRNRGHHFVPLSSVRRIPLSAEARQVFEEATTGQLYYEGNNTWDRAHRIYRDAIDEKLGEFMRRNEIQPETMASNQARAFLREVENSQDPRIRNFNRMIKLRELIKQFRSRGIFGGNE